MSTELRGTINGPEGGMDARRVAAQLTAVLNLIAQVEDVQVGPKRRGGEHSRWALTRLGMGSVNLAIAPLTPLNGADFDTLDRTAEAVIDGLGVIERADLVPEGWSVQATRQAAKLTRNLGSGAESGMIWQLFTDGTLTREVHVTNRVHANAREALRVRHESIGSATGTLGSIGVIKKMAAGLWLTRTRERVPLSFAPEQLAMVRDALNRDVRVAGRIQRNAEGQLLGISVRTITAAASSGRMSDMEGIDPLFTGGMTTVDYLDSIRGAS